MVSGLNTNSCKRIAGAALAVALAAVPGMLAPAAAETLDLSYSMSIGGISVAELSVRADISGHTYRIVSLMQSRRTLRFVARFESRAEATGTFEAGTLKPESYVSETQFRRKERSVRIDYAPDGTITATVTPSTEEEDREAVPPEDIPGTVDPVSAMLLGISGISGAPPCSQDVAVFDGRQRYDLIVGDTVIENLPGKLFAGRALRCEIEWVQISGKARAVEDRPLPDEFGGGGRAAVDENKPRKGYIWLVRLAGSDFLIPVKFEIGGLVRMRLELEGIADRELVEARVTDRPG